MNLVQMSVMAIAGAGAVAGAASLIVGLSSGRDRRIAFGHATAGAAIVVYCVQQAIRYQTADVALMDVCHRLQATLSAIFFLVTLDSYLAVSGRRPGRIDVTLGLLATFCVGWVWLSPHGMFSGKIERIAEDVMPWGEVLRSPVARPGLIYSGIMLVLFAILIRLSQVAARSARTAWHDVSTSRRERAICVLMFALPLGMIAAALWNAAVRAGMVHGPLLMEYAVLIQFGVFGLRVFDRQVTTLRERERLTSVVRDREQKLSVLLEHGATHAGLLDLEGRIVLANRTLLASIAARAEEVVGRPISELAFFARDGAYADRFVAACSRVRAGERDHFLASHPSGELELELWLGPWCDESGRVRGVIVEGHDVTERGLYERRLREGSKLEAVGRLAGGVAHDFNNMLTAIVGTAELGRDATKDGDAATSFERIVDAAERASRLVQRLLSFSHQGRAQSVAFRVNAMMEETASLFASTAGPRIRVELDLDATDDVVIGDPGQIQSALLNLLVNARDAMPNGGVVTLSTENVGLDAAGCGELVQPVPPGHYVRLAVRDTGSGMDLEIRERIFEPFFTTKRTGEGTGLGLPSVLGTARAHQGGLGVATSPGAGSTFTLYLPMAPVDAGVSPVATFPALRPAAGRKILIVDDEGLVRDLAAKLVRVLGLEPELADGPTTALSLFEHAPERFAAAMIDVSMPEMDGFRLAALLRARRPEIPLLMCSGYYRDDVMPGPADPRSCFLAKPFRLRDLGERLRVLGVLQAG